MATSKSSTSRVTKQPTPPEIIAYDFRNEWVYVAPATTLEGAREEAKKVFPALADVPNSSINFFMTLRKLCDNTIHVRRISESAWPWCRVNDFQRGELLRIDIDHVEDSKKLPGPSTSLSDAAADPPRYLDVTGLYQIDKKEKEGPESLGATRLAPSSRRGSPSPSQSRLAKLFGRDRA